MSPEEAGFWQAILDHPDDDAVRLVYADWLEEQGQAERAELIRLQCELERPTAEGVERHPLEQRVQELTAFFEQGWRSEFYIEQLRAEWHRGILSGIKIENVMGGGVVERFVQYSETIFSYGPPIVLQLSSNVAISPATLKTLLAFEGVRWVRHMELGDFDRTVAHVLAQSSKLSKLRSLTVWSNTSGADRVRVLAESPVFSTLTSLDVLSEGLGPETVNTILDSPILSQVTDLALPGVTRPNFLSAGWADFSWPDYNSYPSIGPEGVRTLLSSPNAARLRHLNIRDNGIGEPEAQAILDSPYLRDLQTLRLGECRDDHRRCTLSPPMQDALKSRFGKDVIGI